MSAAKALCAATPYLAERDLAALCAAALGLGAGGVAASPALTDHAAAPPPPPPPPTDDQAPDAPQPSTPPPTDDHAPDAPQPPTPTPAPDDYSDVWGRPPHADEPPLVARCHFPEAKTDDEALAMRLARLEMDLPPYPDGQHPPLWRRERTGVGRFIPGQGYQQTAMEMSSSVGSLAGTTRHLHMLARSLFFADALINQMAPADAEAAIATRYEVGKAIIGLTGRPDLCGNQIYFNVRVFGSFDASSSAVLRELDESDRFVQKSAESTSI